MSCSVNEAHGRYGNKNRLTTRSDKPKRLNGLSEKCLAVSSATLSPWRVGRIECGGGPACLQALMASRKPYQGTM